MAAAFGQAPTARAQALALPARKRRVGVIRLGDEILRAGLAAVRDAGLQMIAGVVHGDLAPKGPSRWGGPVKVNVVTGGIVLVIMGGIP